MDDKMLDERSRSKWQYLQEVHLPQILGDHDIIYIIIIINFPSMTNIKTICKAYFKTKFRIDSRTNKHHEVIPLNW